MNWHRLLQNAAIGFAIYAAATIQVALGDEDGPQWLLALAAWWLCTTAPHHGTLGVAGIGLCLDVMGHDRVGLHLAICGVLAALVRSCLTGDLASRVWSYPLVTFWLVWGDLTISHTIRGLSSGAPIDLPSFSSKALLVAGETVGIVLLLMFCFDLVGRYFRPITHAGSPRLNNRWSRLAEE